MAPLFRVGVDIVYNRKFGFEFCGRQEAYLPCEVRVVLGLRFGLSGVFKHRCSGILGKRACAHNT
jgi:hypothetical protein